MSRPSFLNIPCGGVLGHGEFCSDGDLCSSCQYILDLEISSQNLIQSYRKYIESLDDINHDEMFNTDKGFAMREFSNFLKFYGIEFPDWVKEYYED